VGAKAHRTAGSRKRLRCKEDSQSETRRHMTTVEAVEATSTASRVNGCRHQVGPPPLDVHDLIESGADLSSST
jgi:hypothetical protein